MIYTCTTNPSLDYYLMIDESNVDSKDIRSNSERYEAGGKGVNVSIVLSNLSIPSASLGFLGGFTKDFYTSFLKDYHFIQPLFTSILDNTRINVKIIGQKETSINAVGPIITADEFERFKKRLFNIYPGDYFVLSGNVQDSIKDKIIDIIKQLSENNVKVILDTNEDIANECLKYKPFLVNISDYINNPNDLSLFKEKALDFKKKGAINIVSVKYGYKSFLYDDQLYYLDIKDTDFKVSVGYSDAFVAGYLYTSIRGGSSLESFKYGVSTAFNSTLDVINNLRETIENDIQNYEVKNEKDC